MKKEQCKIMLAFMESIIQMKKEYSEHLPNYLLEPKADDYWIMSIEFEFQSDLLDIASLLDRMSTYTINIVDNHHLRIS